MSTQQSMLQDPSDYAATLIDLGFSEDTFLDQITEHRLVPQAWVDAVLGELRDQQVRRTHTAPLQGAGEY